MKTNDNHDNRTLLRNAWKTAGFRKGRYPASTRDVLALGRIVGFDTTAERFVKDVKSGKFKPPVDGKWDEAAVLKFFDYLDRERAYLIWHPANAAKLTPEETKRAAKQGKQIEDFLAHCFTLEVPDLLRLIITADAERNRELIGVAIAAKLGLLNPEPQLN